MTTSPEPDRLTRLAETAADLAADYAELAEANGDQFVFLTKRARSNRRMIRALAVVLAVVLGLAAALGWVVVQVRHNENANAANQAATAALAHRLDVAQTTTRQKTLCPLYSVLLGAENPKARAVFPQGPAAYDHVFEVIKEGYDALECLAIVVAPPKSG